jgi:hypothetical protein
MKILVQFSGGKDSQACLIKEVWKSVDDYEGFYEVSNMGDVRSMNRYTKDGKFLKGKVLKQGLCTSGYKHVVFCKDGIKKDMLVHRLVARAFLQNENKYAEINHKDEDKCNNVVSNLEWCDRVYNNNYNSVAARNLLKATKAIIKGVLQIKDGRTIGIFESMKEAERATGIFHESISACCRGKRRSAGGFNWSYK